MGFCFGFGFDLQGGFTSIYRWRGDDSSFERVGIGLRVWRFVFYVGIFYVGKEVRR